MTLRPIAPHGVGVVEDKRTAYRPPSRFGAILWAGLGERVAAGVTGSRANPRICTS